MADGARDRLFRGYGPLIGFAAIFLAVAVLVPSQQREVRVEATGGSGRGSELSSDDAEVAGATETVPGSETGVDATGGSLDGTAGGTAGGGAGGPGGANAKGGSNSGPPKVAGCGAAVHKGVPRPRRSTWNEKWKPRISRIQRISSELRFMVRTP